MTTLKEEDKLPLKEVLKAVRLKMQDVLRVVDALNLGRTEVKPDGVYRTFNDGIVVKIASGDLKKNAYQIKGLSCFKCLLHQSSNNPRLD